MSMILIWNKYFHFDYYLLDITHNKQWNTACKNTKLHCKLRTEKKPESQWSLMFDFSLKNDVAEALGNSFSDIFVFLSNK